jgi:fimbrial chaperone protein
MQQGQVMKILRILTAIVSPLLLLPGTSRAAAVIIWPVDPKIAATERATALWIENKGNEPITMQVRTLRWSQGPQGDLYDDQDEVVASPPIAVIPAGERQMIRVLRRERPAVALSDQASPGERSYRLLIDEIPTANAPNASRLPAAELAVQMRYSVPLFTYAGSVSAAKPELTATVERSGSGRTLAIRNTGMLHARLVDIRTADDKKTQVASGLAGYVLAGQTMRWPVPDGVPEISPLMANVNGADQRIAAR